MVSFAELADHKHSLAVVGLGYVGLPLAVHLARHFKVVGYDLKTQRIEELLSGQDRTREVSPEELAGVEIAFTDDPAGLSDCRLIIVAVPTPIDAHRIPDLTPLKTASQTVGRHLQKGACVVFESTVYPGATEEVCVPLMAAASGLTAYQDFSVGLLARADQPRRQGPHPRTHRKGRLGFRRPHPRPARQGLWHGRTGGHPPGQQHPRGRGRQGDREHPAGPEHRADERAFHDLRPHGHRHVGGTGGGRQQVELSCPSNRVWSAATASASTPIT
jgi:hypothetical protein